jgi:hypothetical protein
MGAEKLSPPAPLALDRGSAKVSRTCPLASLLDLYLELDLFASLWQCIH